MPLLVPFWAVALGHVEQAPPPGIESWHEWAASEGIPEAEWDGRGALMDPEGKRSRVFFQKVPEEKSGKNRLHLDVNAGGGHDVDEQLRRDSVDAHVDWLLTAGGAVVQEFNQGDERWIVMQDPEGNEFCVQ